MWKTNDAEMHGRTGQPQAGVDVYGADRVEGQFVGVQCKGKDQSYGNPLTAAELRKEVTKAQSFDPPLDLFVLATTAPNDATIQKLGRQLTQKHKRSRLFEVRVVGWSSLRQRVTDYPDIVKKYFPDFAPADVVGAIEAGVEITRAFLQEAFRFPRSHGRARRPRRRTTRSHSRPRQAHRGRLHRSRAESVGATLVERIRLASHAAQPLSHPGQYRICQDRDW